jgi:Kdo2-lipid IVA lauroyltransferase/acyltransferase
VKIKFHRDVFYGLLALFQTLLKLLPYAWAFQFCGFMGKTVFFVASKERKKALSHLRMAFSEEKTEAEIRKIAFDLFEHYGKTMGEFLLFDKIQKNFDKYVSTVGLENFDEALAQGKGVVVTIAHFGNWELMGAYTALKGYPCTVIARKIYFKKYDDFIVRIRKSANVETIYRDESVRRMFSVLRRNGMLGFVADQDVEDAEGVFVPFFDRPAFTPSAPVRFALTSGAPIVPVFMLREGKGGICHRMVVEKPIPLVRTGNKEEDLRLNTEKWVAVQEKYIRQYPHLWVWNHKRWKTTEQIRNLSSPNVLIGDQGRFPLSRE